MNALLKTRETAVWLVLMLVSIANWILGSQDGSLDTSQHAAVAVLLTLAFFKVGLIMRYFMEIRHASKEQKLSCGIWLLCTYILVTAANVGKFN